MSKLPNMDEYLNAAKKLPSARSAAEQALVDRGSNMQEVRNADFQAHREERVNGPVR